MKPKGCYWTTAHYTENTMRSVTVKVRKLNKNVEQWLLSGFHPDHVYFYWLWFKAGFHLGNFPQVRNGQGSFLCVRAISSNRELTRQRKLFCPFPSWGKLSWVETSIKPHLQVCKDAFHQTCTFFVKSQYFIWRGIGIFFAPPPL